MTGIHIIKPYLEQIVETTHTTEKRFIKIGDLKNKRFLDLGSASGFDCVEMALAGAYAVGVELSDGRIEFNKELMIEKKVHHNIIKTDAAMLPFKRGVFDMVQCKHLIEHLSLPADRIKEFAGLLSPGGMLYIDFPNRYHLKQILSDDHYKLPLICLLPRPLAKYLVVKVLKYESNYSTNIFISVPFFEKTVKSLGSKYKIIYPESELIKSKLLTPHKINNTIIRKIIHLINRMGLIHLLHHFIDKPFFRGLFYPNISALIIQQ